MVGVFNSKGNINWELYSFDDIGKMSFAKDLSRLKAVSMFLKTLSPEQSLYAKIYGDHVYVPELIEPNFKEKKK